MTMAGRIAVMSEGRLLQVGPPDEIYEAPATRFVADFIGNVNLMDGSLVESAADHAVVDCGDITHWIGKAVAGGRGQRVTVALRPEKIRIGRAEPTPHGLAADPSLNRVRGIVKEVAYFGSFTVYHLGLAGGATLKISQSNAERQAGDTLARDHAAWASWTPGSQMVLTI